MRLWSIHPMYLDQKGLVACWCESLLAKKVLEGNTKGYKNHPQLNRFKENNHLSNINLYLSIIHSESINRGYKFDSKKIDVDKIKLDILQSSELKISVTRGQLVYEFQHILKKTSDRDLKWYDTLQLIKQPIECNPIFQIKESAAIESWEKI